MAEPLVLMVAPLAPHIAEELWCRLGHDGSLAYAAFPQADPALATPQTVTIPVQVNGRTKFRIEVPSGLASAEAERIVTGHPDYQRHTAGISVTRLIIVPDRIINVITG